MGRFIPSNSGGKHGKLLPHDWIKPAHHFTHHTVYRGRRRNDVMDMDKERSAILAARINESLSRRVMGFLSNVFQKKNFQMRSKMNRLFQFLWRLLMVTEKTKGKSQ
jgi:hypothetical protein